MGSRTITRRTILAGLMARAAALGDSDKDVFASVRAMEDRERLTIFGTLDSVRHRWRGARKPRGGDTVWPAISPDATALCWGRESSSSAPEYVDRGPFLTITTAKDRLRPIEQDGQWAGGFVISSGPEIIVTTAISLAERCCPAKLLVIDVRSGVSVEDFTSRLPLRVPLSISGSGMLVAFGDGKDQLQIREIPSCNTVYKGAGRYPRLSPDGKCLAFIREDRLYIRTLEDGSTKEFLTDTPTLGIGGWSPDGRYLLAGAWTRRPASNKQLVALDTVSGRYAELATLGESDYGNRLRWVSTDLMAR